MKVKVVTADVVLGLVKPNMYDKANFAGYNISKLQDNFIAAFLMKNRYGVNNKMIPLIADQSVGMFYDAPIPDEFNNNPSLYDKYNF